MELASGALAACSLKLGACGLELAARGSGLPAEKRYRLAPLMQSICNIFDVLIPTVPAVLARVPLSRGRAAGAFGHHGTS